MFDRGLVEGRRYTRLVIACAALCCFACTTKKVEQRYEDGKIKKVCYVKKGADGNPVVVGAYREFWPSGRLRAQGCADGNGLFHGRLTKWYESGNVSSVRNYVHGLISGKETAYYPSGTVNLTNTYRNGKKNGWSFVYFESGAVSEKTYYVDGKAEGTDTLFYPDGKIRQATEFVGGDKSGSQVTFYANGQRETEMRYVKGKRDGQVRVWWPNGSLKMVGMAENDTPCGVAQVHDSTGALVRDTLYAEPCGDTTHPQKQSSAALQQ